MLKIKKKGKFIRDFGDFSRKEVFKWQANVNASDQLQKPLLTVRIPNSPNILGLIPKPSTPYQDPSYNRSSYPQRGQGNSGNNRGGRGNTYYPPSSSGTQPYGNGNYQQSQNFRGKPNFPSGSRGGYFQNNTNHNGWRDDYNHYGILSLLTIVLSP